MCAAWQGKERTRAGGIALFFTSLISWCELEAVVPALLFCFDLLSHEEEKGDRCYGVPARNIFRLSCRSLGRVYYCFTAVSVVRLKGVRCSRGASMFEHCGCSGL